MRRLTLLVTVATIALAPAVPAWATPPQSESFASTAFDSQSCAGSDANIERNFTGRETTYFDNRGNPVRLQVNFAMQGSVTNSVTGRTVALRGHGLVVVNLVDGSTSFSGQVLMANGKGVGSLIRDTGRIVVDADGNIIFEAGGHDAIDSDGAVFCSAVS